MNNNSPFPKKRKFLSSLSLGILSIVLVSMTYLVVVVWGKLNFGLQTLYYIGTFIVGACGFNRGIKELREGEKGKAIACIIVSFIGMILTIVIVGFALFCLFIAGTLPG